ncbi:hypothetical protein SADUNF_Sadunf05G0167900 [Salix dunnii]|uniref:Uncharacterized protein n=1 Tax=Salix dunnii TaxID=1413687 RepID=A0A835KBQ2_9ROSI|nr:hypothetical protein SADUNF_Sadunf05G0167900 [Salix dunnii]
MLDAKSGSRQAIQLRRGRLSRKKNYEKKQISSKWSAIAAELPGRTDNEIKNVWHTHLKKRVEKDHVTPEIKGRSVGVSRLDHELKTDQELVNSSSLAAGSDQTEEHRPISPQQCSSDTSSVTTGDIDISNNMCMKMESSDDFPEMDENFWSEVLFAETPSMAGDYSGIATETQLQFPFSPLVTEAEQIDVWRLVTSDLESVGNRVVKKPRIGLLSTTMLTDPQPWIGWVVHRIWVSHTRIGSPWTQEFMIFIPDN